MQGGHTARKLPSGRPPANLRPLSWLLWASTASFANSSPFIRRTSAYRTFLSLLLSRAHASEPRLQTKGARRALPCDAFHVGERLPQLGGQCL